MDWTLRHVAPPLARWLLVASWISATTGGCCSCWGNEPGDAKVDIPACKAQFTWPAGPTRVIPLSEHLTKEPKWMSSHRTNGLFDIRWAGKQTQLPITDGLDTAFDNAGATIDVKNAASVLCRMTGSPDEMVTTTIGQLEVGIVLYQKKKHVTFAAPGVPLDAGTNVTFRTESELPGACYQTGFLGIRWTQCSSKTVKSPLGSTKSKGTLPIVVSSNGNSLECRGITAEALSSAIVPKLQAVEKAYAQSCERLGIKSGSPGTDLDDKLLEVAAFTGWADPRVLAGFVRRDELHSSWLRANKPIAMGQPPGFPKEIPAILVTSPIFCDAEAKKRFSVKWTYDEKTEVPCRFEITLPKASEPTTISVGGGRVSRVEEQGRWSLNFDALQPDGTELGSMEEPTLPGGKETADLGAENVMTTWILKMPLDKPKGPIVLRVEGSYTKKGDFFPTSHYAFMVVPAP